MIRGGGNRRKKSDWIISSRDDIAHCISNANFLKNAVIMFGGSAATCTTTLNAVEHCSTE